MQIEDNSFIGPRKSKEISDNAIYINHSCEPNVGFYGQITCIAMKDINIGEELTQNYAMCFTNTQTFSNMEYGCGSKKCRGKITENDWENKDLQDRYKNYFALFILRKLKSWNSPL